MTVGRDDPEYEAALAEARQAAAALGGAEGASLSAELAALQAGLDEDAREAQQLTYWVISTINGLDRLSKGSLQLREGLFRLARGAKRIQAVLDQQVERAQVLRTGTAAADRRRRAAGGGDGAARRRDRTAPRRARRRLSPLLSPADGAPAGDGSGLLDRPPPAPGARPPAASSPGLFDSGYVVLSALDGSPPRQRQEVGSVVDLEHGGQAATMLVFSRYDLNSEGSIELNRRLAGYATAIGRATDASRRGGRRPGDAQHLQPRRPRPHPARRRRDLPRHLPRSWS